MHRDDYTSPPSVVVLKPKPGTTFVIFCLGIAAGLCLAGGWYFYKHDKPKHVSVFENPAKKQGHQSSGEQLANGWQEGTDGRLFYLKTLTINDSKPLSLNLPELAGCFVFIWDGIGSLQWRPDMWGPHWRTAEMHQTYEKTEYYDISVKVFGREGFRLFCFFYPEQSQDEFEPQT